MFRRKKYILRHKILKALQEPLSEYHQKDTDPNDGMMTIDEIIKRSGLQGYLIEQHLSYIKLQDELHIASVGEASYYLITPKGLAAYYDKKYLEEGRSDWIKRFRDIFFLISAVVTFLFTIWTFVANVYLTKKNTQDIQTLKEQSK